MPSRLGGCRIIFPAKFPQTNRRLEDKSAGKGERSQILHGLAC